MDDSLMDEDIDAMQQDVSLTPQYANSVDGGGSEPASPDNHRDKRPRSNFERAFPNVQPNHDPPRISLNPTRTVPSSLVEYWVANVPDQLRSFAITGDNIFKGECMTPDVDQTKRMYARSKCMKLIHPEDQSLLSDPTRTTPLCFVQKTGAELPLHIQMCIYLFTSLLNHATPDITHFVAPSTTVGVHYDQADPRVIRGLVSTGEGLGVQDAPLNLNRARDEFIDINEILADRDLDQNGEIHVPVAPLSMHIGFTGVVFQVNGEEKREVFCVLTVTPAANFSLMSYMHEKFLLRPKQGCQKYDQLLELYLEATAFWKKIIRQEIYENLGVDESKFRSPDDYQRMIGASLGHSTVLSQFQIPFKIYNQIRKEYPDADFGSIRIMGMPKMTFKTTDQTTMDFLQNMNASINADQRRHTQLMEGIRRFLLSKDKESFPELKLPCVGGWPVEVDENLNVTCFGLPPLPLMHSFDPQGARGNFAVFTASIGDADKALPDFTRLILTAFLVHSSPVNVRPSIEHMLKDDRVANPLVCLQKYFGSDVDPFSALIIANRNRVWLDALVLDVANKRAAGVDVFKIVTGWKDYLRSSVRNLRSSIYCHVFRSRTVEQMLELHNQTCWREVCITGKDSIRSVLRKKGERVSVVLRHNRFLKTWTCFMTLWEDMNRFFFLNAGNLVCAVEVMISQLMFKFAHTNDTWVFFYATVLVMAGNGHFSTHTPDGPMPDRKKPNTTGMDFTLARLADIWNAFYERYMIPKKDRFHELQNCMRFTPTVWENLVCATSLAGRIVTVPPHDSNFQIMSITENRDALKSIIQFGPPRGEEGKMRTYNSAEQADKSRVATVKQKLYNNNIACIASNLSSKNKDEGEEGRTLDAVCAIIPPGIGPPTLKKRKISFASSDPNANNARHQPLDSHYKDAVVNCIAFTQNFAGLFFGLLNHVGAMTVECNKVSLEIYDFLCHYIKQFYGGGMDTFAVEAFSRMKEGYKSRGVVLSVWLKVFGAMSLDMTVDQTIEHVWFDIHRDALPIVAIPSVCCNLMYRSIHMGSLLMISIMARSLGVPRIDWKNLDRFFNDSRKPAADEPDVNYVEDYNAIRRFVASCLENNQMCPGDEGGTTCYITSPGTPEHTPTSKTSIMRYIPGRRDEDSDLTSRLADRIQSQHGRHLSSQCHMGPERHVYMYALRFLLERFAPDLRGLISHKMYCSRQHLEGLELLWAAPGIQDYEESDAPPFAKQFSFRVGNELRSSAIGLNIWGLLTTVCLCDGTEPHPHLSNTVSNNLMTHLLEFTPAGVTPGDRCKLRCFHVHTTSPVQLHIQSKNRPGHFWRPEDASFVQTGALPIAQAMGKWMPEDLLPNPSLYDIATRDLMCDLMEVPANAFTTSPNLMPDVYYSFHVPKYSNDTDESVGDYGTIHVVSNASSVDVVRFDKNREPLEPLALDFDTWDVDLRKMNMVVTPLITRGGVCVCLNLGGGDSTQKTLGCLIKYQDEKSYFNPSTCCYQALMTDEMDVAQIFFLDLFKDCIVPIGEIVYLDVSVLPEEGFRAQGAGGKLLYTRLAPPNVHTPEEGKLYVMGLYQPLGRRGACEVSASPITFAVNPWDIQLASDYTGSQTNILKRLR